MKSEKEVKGIVFFLPTIENHLSNFIPLIEPLKAIGYHCKMIIVEEAIPKKRKFIINDDVINDSINCNVLEIDNLFKDVKSSNSILLVGNDSEPIICEVIRKFKQQKHKVILVQDGWLEAKNINNPIYPEQNTLTNLKKLVHKFLTKSWMPTKKYFHNFIGQNADLFFVYSEIAKQNFVQSKVKVENIFITGSPRHALLRQSKINTIGPDVIVLFSTVTESNGELVVIKKYINWIKDVYPNIKLLIKLHPLENEEKYSDIIESTDTETTRMPINQIIESFRIEMSFCFASTVVLDMLVLSIPIIQMAPPELDWRYVNYYRDLPMVRKKDDMKQEIEKINIETLKQVGSRYLIDIDATKNSTDLTINAINTVFS